MKKNPWWYKRENSHALTPLTVEVPLLNIYSVFPKGVKFIIEDIPDTEWNFAREQAWAIREGLTQNVRVPRKKS